MVKLPDDKTSYWIGSTQTPEFPELIDDLEVDVAVIGGGIVGLTTAYLLKESGLTVAVVEKDTVGDGVSGNTTGKITSQHNLIYGKLQERLGKETAWIYGDANQAAIVEIERLVRKAAVDCDFRRADNYVYTTDKSKVGKLKEEANIAASLGLPAYFEVTSDLPFDIAGAVRFDNQATFHIRKYLIGLAKRIDSGGSYVFHHSHVIGIREGKSPRVKTTKGVIHARDIVVATNVPTFPLIARGSYCLYEYPMQSYIVAGRTDRLPSGMYISPDTSHYSIHSVVSGEDKLLLIGGEGHVPGARFNIHARYQRLADYAEKFFGITEITHRWTHRDYLGYDDMPIIGKLYPWSKHVYTATGFMKWGMTNGTMAAIILHDKIVGKPNKWAATFATNRMQATASIPKVIGEKIGIE